MGDAEISGQVSAVDEDGQLRLRRLLFEAEGVPLDLASGAMRGKDGAGVSGDGDVNALIDLKVTDGLEKASGTIELHGNALRITSVSVPNQGIPEMELDAAITELDLRLDGKDGRLEVVRGVMRSTLVEVDLTGEVTLGDQWDRSRLTLELEVVLPSWAGTPLEKFQGMAEAQLASARCDDGKYHYEVSEVLSRLSVGDLRPKRCKSDRGSTGARPTVTSTPAVDGVDPEPVRSPAVAAPVPAAPERPPAPPPIEDEVPAEEVEEDKVEENEEDVPEEL
jgi:type II secretion system protein N